jgi:squalene-hopene/tetraprenyl-beta-curcumene cyclase
MHRFAILVVLVALLVGCNGSDSTPEASEPREPQAAYDAGLDFLAGRFGEDGWIRVETEGGPMVQLGPTALALAAFTDRPGGLRPDDRELVDRVCDAIVGLQQDNGGIYSGGLGNYTTCAAVLALKSANRDKDRAVIERAVTFLKGLQFDENRGVEPSSEDYGGLGYGTHERPDLSNTQYSLESLRAAGVGDDDPVYKKALAFLQRTQNRSESNPGGVTLPDGRIVTPSDTGGATYRPGESKAGIIELSDGTVALKSYGSMTYALLKCYIYAGLKKDDPRVQAAMRWVKANWTWDENPGFTNPEDGQQGLFYYYSTAAKALDLLDVGILEIDGVKHDWRKELSAKVRSLQRKDGSWVGHPRWWEAMPELATSFALVTLGACIGD